MDIQLMHLITIPAIILSLNKYLNEFHFITLENSNFLLLILFTKLSGLKFVPRKVRRYQRGNQKPSI